jgi:TPR repeat protein
MYAVVTGTQPFKEFQQAFKLANAISNGTRPVLPATVPGPYRTLIQACWAQNPDDRPVFGQIVDHLQQPEFTALVDAAAFDAYRRQVALPPNPVHGFRTAAENGDVNGMLEWAQANESGHGTAKNLTEAAKWYKRAMEQGNPRATHRYAVMLEFGRGVAVNRSEAAQTYKKAADLGDADAQVHFGQLCERGMFKVQKNYTEAIRYCRMAAAQGSLAGTYRLAHALGNSPECISHWKFAADHGKQEAVITFAEICEFGRYGHRVHVVTAARYDKKASDEGNINGTYRLAVMYEEGRGVPRDIGQAIRLYKSLIDKLYPAAFGRYGWILVCGRDIAKDITAGRSLLEQAQEKGDGDSTVRLAQMSAEGIGEKKGQPANIFRIYKQAADSESRIGMLKCAECLIGGVGCKKDIAAAITYYRQLIDKWNDPVALLQLGKLTINGTGVRKDLKAGLELVERSKDAGNAEAAAFLTERSAGSKKR